MKAGKEYEMLIEQMYRSLAPNSLVTLDDYIYDSRAQTKRQIDVSIRYKFAGVNHLIIVQAKDYKRKADIAVVDQFQQVIEDVNANKGILICSKGFSKTAITKAKNYGMECLSIHSALKKNWETLLKIPVRKTVHEFGLELNIGLNIAHKAGKEVTFLDQTFSYDKKNIVSLTDVVYKEIIKKHEWSYIKKGHKIRIDLKSLGLFHSFDNEMLPIFEGHIEINYSKSHVSNFYVEPINYLYQKNHIEGTNNLHNLTLSEDIMDEIVSIKQTNDSSITESPIVSSTVYYFNNSMYTSVFQFSVPGGIIGNYLIKGNSIMKDDSKGRAIVELENTLKGI